MADYGALSGSDKSVLEPFIGLKGVWDFARTEQATAAGVPVSNDALRAWLEGGLTYRTPSGITLRASGSYDGVGSSTYQAVQGRAAVIIPLQ